MEIKHFRWLAPLLAGIGILLVSLTSFARAPENIGLTRFEAVVAGSTIRLEWDVATEVNTGGYKIRRGENGIFDYLPNSDGSGDLFIVAEGGPAQAYSYAQVDTAVEQGQVYTYQLIEVTNDSQEVQQGEVTVTMQAQVTNTPIVVPTNDPGAGNNNQSATATPTIAPTATNQPASNPTTVPPTAVPSPTRMPSTAVTAVSSPTAVADSVSQPAASNETFTSDPYPAAQESVSSADDSQSSSESSFAVESASAQELPAVEGSYPGPEADGSQPSEDNIAAAVAAPATQVEQPASIGVTAPVVISGAATDQEAAQPAATTNSAAAAIQDDSDEGGGTLFLWVAFLAALTIFVAAVIGAIILYTRRPSG